jgi:mono/diheme cytochrome c family protein
VKRAGPWAATFTVAFSVVSAPLQAAPAFVSTPPAEANYMLNCMGCHLPDGSGAPGKVPSLRESLAQLSLTGPGRRYLVQVPGASQAPLSNPELAQLLNWMVRNLSAPDVPAEFTDFTASEVAGYRRSTLVNVRDARARVLGGATDRGTR